MTNAGQLRSGSDFLKQSTEYLRIGPVGGGPPSDLGMSYMSKSELLDEVFVAGDCYLLMAGNNVAGSPPDIGGVGAIFTPFTAESFNFVASSPGGQGTVQGFFVEITVSGGNFIENVGGIQDGFKITGASATPLISQDEYFDFEDVPSGSGSRIVSLSYGGGVRDGTMVLFLGLGSVDNFSNDGAINYAGGQGYSALGLVGPLDFSYDFAGGSMLYGIAATVESA